ncbi:MAG: cupin domain-containing protein [Candidatus Endonucleobacter bathymodioli]|uniref:Cupin domain-containing protein n=1 Tax=Candidatus Endonucleibacter bathymodioli TaxID=539814 RepID=A0AA90NJI8_9GAMM|nr:cupin domain-containing protein [Candidatus Endonucleobacter bathymodioli]
MTNYWQKMPTIINNGFAGFIDPISPDELAGLAMEEDIDSRLVYNSNNQWKVEHGPFESFDHLPESHTQIIVQAANHWHQRTHALVKPFKCFPGWLLDDVMVCLSLPKGGVGPHVDQYDVFIIQGMGKRYWRVGSKGCSDEANHNAGLCQIVQDNVILEKEMISGDILYIPAGFPHEGQALETSLSYSLGFRSPKARELLSSFADYIISQGMGDTHYYNPNMATRNDHGAIYQDEYQSMISMMENLFNNEKVKRQWLGEHLSLSRHELDIAAPDTLYQPRRLYQLLSNGEKLQKLAGLRAFYHPASANMLHINGDTFGFPEYCSDAAMALSNLDSVTAADLGTTAIEDHAFIATVTRLMNLGYWYFDECESSSAEVLP